MLHANIDSNSYTWYGAIKYDNVLFKQSVFLLLTIILPNVEFNYVYDMVIDKRMFYLTGTSNMPQ